MKLGIDRAIRRLLKQNRHFLAIRICEYMNMKTDFIVNDWARSVVGFAFCLSQFISVDQAVKNFRRRVMLKINRKTRFATKCFFCRNCKDCI